MPKSDKTLNLDWLRDKLSGRAARRAQEPRAVPFPYGCNCGHPVPPLEVPTTYRCSKCNREWHVEDRDSPQVRRERAAKGRGSLNGYEWRCSGYDFNVVNCRNCGGHNSRYERHHPGPTDEGGGTSWKCRKCGQDSGPQRYDGMS